VRLTDEQRTRYEQDGFLAIERLVDEDTLQALRDAYDDVLERDVPARGDRMLGGITRQVMMPSTAHPVFDANPAIDEATEIATDVFGTAAVRFFDMLIFKPAGHPHETPWHQDMAYADMPTAPAGRTIPLETIQFWVALDDVDEVNGCMHFVPGAHLEPLLEHVVAGGEPDDPARLLALTDAPRQLDLERVVPAPLRAGGATMHSYGTPHMTPPNRSADRPRRAYIFNLASERGLRSVVDRD
jgi:ectoine hydroxylase-related dioxygenase (phytanoyl-CoA dioxygenase family)